MIWHCVIDQKLGTASVSVVVVVLRSSAFKVPRVLLGFSYFFAIVNDSVERYIFCDIVLHVLCFAL